MNDIGYENINFVGSVNESTVNCLSLDELRYRRGYTKGAVDYHTQEINPNQIAFFTSELNLIDKRIKQLSRNNQPDILKG